MTVLISLGKWQAMIQAFADAPQENGRFAGTYEQQQQLVAQMRDLPAGDPGDDSVRIDGEELSGLASDLADASPNWSIGQFSAALASLTEDSS